MYLVSNVDLDDLPPAEGVICFIRKFASVTSYRSII